MSRPAGEARVGDETRNVGGGGARGPSRRAFLSLLAAGAATGAGVGYALHRRPRGAREADTAGTRGSLYFSSGFTTYALRASDGAIRWTRAINSLGPIAVTGGSVYVVDANGYVYALDATTGRVLWNRQAGSLYEQPLAYRDLVYVGSPDSQIFALDAATGEVRWRVVGQPNPAANAGALTIAQGLLFASGSNSSYIITPQNGRVLGKFNSLVHGAADGIIYLTAPDATSLQAWNLATKRAAWTLRPPGAQFGPVAGGGGLLYSGLVNTAAYECCTRADQASEDWTGQVFAYAAATGRSVWSYPAPATGFSAPLLTSGVVYIAGDFNVYALNAATGRPHWVMSTAEQLRTTQLEIGPAD